MEQGSSPKILINNVSYKLRHKDTAIIDFEDFPFRFDYIHKEFIKLDQFYAICDK